MGDSRHDPWAVAPSVGDTSRGRDPNLYMNPSRLGLQLAPPQQHWFKERLRTRVFKERTKEEAHKFLVGRNWTFVKDGLDDFRTGAPPDEGPESVLRPKAYGVIGPNVFLTDETRHKRATGIKERAIPRRGGGGVVGGVSGKTTAAASTEPPSKASRWKPEEKMTLLFGKSTLTQTSKKRHIESLETSLLAHPLALYPHIEEGMPSDVFETVVDILDPELNIGSEANFDDDALIAKQRRKGESMTAEHGDHSMAELTTEQLTPTQPSHMMTGQTVSGLASANNTATQEKKTLHQNNSPRESTVNRVSSHGQRKASTTRVQNTKRTANTNKSSTNKGSNAGTSNSATLTANTANQHSRRKKSLLNHPQESPSLDLHISNITKDFCDWVAGIGGETNNIEEATVASLFASGYETKPALSVPILIVEDGAVPTELKGGDAPPPPTALTGKEEEEETEETRKSRAESRRRKTKELEAPSSSTVEPRPRFRYGAWYLPPKLWRPLNVGEGLEDPKKLEDKAMSEGKIRSDKLDIELAPLHGSKVFIEYLEKKESRLPNFLTRVSQLQDEIDALQVEERGTTAATRKEVGSRGAATARSKAASRGGN